MSTQAVEEIVEQYISESHPLLECLDVSVLKLDETWLAQATVQNLAGTDLVERLVLLVSEIGVVEEVGGSVSRKSAQRQLAGLKTAVHAPNNR